MLQTESGQENHVTGRRGLCPREVGKKEKRRDEGVRVDVHFPLTIARRGLTIFLLSERLRFTFTEPKLKIVVFGTPAEEGGGGKILMINNGCFKGVDLCMMVHPSPVDMLKPTILARDKVTVTYKGHASHAAAFPWEGVNALDAAVMAYNSISVLRQQMKPTWRVHGIITEGGVKPNIIPDRTQLQYYLRAPTVEELDLLRQKVTSCFEAAATATGKHCALFVTC